MPSAAQEVSSDAAPVWPVRAASRLRMPCRNQASTKSDSATTADGTYDAETSPTMRVRSPSGVLAFRDEMRRLVCAFSLRLIQRSCPNPGRRDDAAYGGVVRSLPRRGEGVTSRRCRSRRRRRRSGHRCREWRRGRRPWRLPTDVACPCCRSYRLRCSPGKPSSP